MITLAWDDSTTDLDLTVTEPGGEVVYWSNRHGVSEGAGCIVLDLPCLVATETRGGRCGTVFDFHELRANKQRGVGQLTGSEQYRTGQYGDGTSPYHGISLSMD